MIRSEGGKSEGRRELREKGIGGGFNGSVGKLTVNGLMVNG